MSDWNFQGENWTPESPQSEIYDPTWPYNFKWGVSPDNQVAVWRAKGGVDGRPTHRAELTQLWGREPRVRDGDVMGLATYIPAEEKMDGTVVAPPLVKLQTYYGQPTPAALYTYFQEHFPGTQVVEATIVKPKLGKVAGDFDEWRNQQDGYTGKSVKWVLNEEETPSLLMWEVTGQDGYPLHPQKVLEDWGRRYKGGKDHMGYADLYPDRLLVENYGRVPAKVIQEVQNELRKRYPSMEVDMSKALTETEEPMFLDSSNISVVSRSGAWASRVLGKNTSTMLLERSVSDPNAIEVDMKGGGWTDSEPADQMGLSRENVIYEEDGTYTLDDYEAQELLKRELIVPMKDWGGGFDMIPGAYQLTAKIWDDWGLTGQEAFDWLDNLLQRNKPSNDQTRWNEIDPAFDPTHDHFDPVLMPESYSSVYDWATDPGMKLAGADLDGCMIALFLPEEAGEKLKQPGGEPVEMMHITLIYFQDKQDDRDDWEQIERLVEQFANQKPPMEGSINGFGVFQNDEDVLWATPSIKGLAELRSDLLEACEDAGFPVSSNYDWVPHITLKYGWSGELPKLDNPLDITFDALSFAKGDKPSHMMFKGNLEKEALDRSPMISYTEPMSKVAAKKWMKIGKKVTLQHQPALRLLRDK